MAKVKSAKHLPLEEELKQELERHNLAPAPEPARASSPGFSIGLGVGLLVGAVASSLLLTKAGSDLVALIEAQTSRLKEKAGQLMDSPELKEKAAETPGRPAEGRPADSAHGKPGGLVM